VFYFRFASDERACKIKLK